MSSIRILILIAAGLTVSAGSSAADRQTYKYVDEKGNVTYSQTPPPDVKDAKKVNITPASSSRGGYTGGGSANPYPNQYSNREQYEQARQAQQKQREEAEQKRLAALKAECDRNRGTDCNNPETLRHMESQRARGGRYHLPPR